jgi:hypothetical protein
MEDFNVFENCSKATVEFPPPELQDYKFFADDIMLEFEPSKQKD